MKEIVGGIVRVAVLASGGKDSTYASWWAQLQGWEVVSLVTVLVKGEDSMTVSYTHLTLPTKRIV